MSIIKYFRLRLKSYIWGLFEQFIKEFRIHRMTNFLIFGYPISQFPAKINQNLQLSIRIIRFIIFLIDKFWFCLVFQSNYGNMAFENNVDVFALVEINISLILRYSHQNLPKKTVDFWIDFEPLIWYGVKSESSMNLTYW